MSTANPSPVISAAIVGKDGRVTKEWDGFFRRMNRVLSNAEDNVAGLGVLKASTLQTISGHWLIEVAEDKSYRLVLKCPYACTITETTTIADAGTCTATIKINSTPLGGTANSVSTSEQSQTHTTANAVAVGDDIVLTVSSNAGCEGLALTIKADRSLDP